MFDEILQIVKDQLNGNPHLANSIPNENTAAVHDDIAAKVTDSIKGQAINQGGIEGLLSTLQNGIGEGSMMTNAISGGLISSLTSKFGLPPAITGAIAGMLPALLQKFANKVNDPHDPSITPQSINSSLGVK